MRYIYIYVCVCVHVVKFFACEASPVVTCRFGAFRLHKTSRATEGDPGDIGS